MTAVIRARQLSKYFPLSGRFGLRALLFGLAEHERFVAVDAVDLNVVRGEVVGILGRNGAGKSTLLRLVAGIYAADAGSVSVGGTAAGLFELGGFGGAQLTGREFAIRYLQMFGMARRARDTVLQDIHEFSELGTYFDEQIRTYSSGMGARLYFATATAIPHDVYLIDEILSVGDEHFQTKSWARMRRRLTGGASGLLVTHDWSAVIKLCRRSKILDAGKVVCEGRSDKVVATYLNLPPPQLDRARILPVGAQQLTARSGTDTTLLFEVELVQPGPAELAISIEVLQLGVGWESVLLTEFAPIGAAPGRYQVALRIAVLPLGPGEYSLNVFLSTPPAADGGGREVLDSRSWTHSNGWTLEVEGVPAGMGVAPFAIRWGDAP